MGFILEPQLRNPTNVTIHVMPPGLRACNRGWPTTKTTCRNVHFREMVPGYNIAVLIFRGAPGAPPKSQHCNVAVGDPPGGPPGLQHRNANFLLGHRDTELQNGRDDPVAAKTASCMHAVNPMTLLRQQASHDAAKTASSTSKLADCLRRLLGEGSIRPLYNC